MIYHFSFRGRFHRSGFTLLELMLVITLMTLAVGLVAAGISRTLPSTKIRVQARKLAATFRYAKVKARMSGTDSIVTLYPEEGRYELSGRGSHSLPEGMRLVVEDPVEGDLVDGSWNAVFYAAGGARAGAVRLERDDASITVAIDPILGAIPP